MIVSKKVLERLQYIINARLSQEEFEQVKNYANHLKAKRMKKGNTENGGERNEINLYEETDTNGILKEI